MTFWNFGNLALKTAGRLIFHVECNSKKFGLPYFHQQQVKITYKHTGISVCV